MYVHYLFLTDHELFCLLFLPVLSVNTNPYKGVNGIIKPEGLNLSRKECHKTCAILILNQMIAKTYEYFFLSLLVCS